MPVLPLHLGAVHAIEWALSIVLVVGPLIALGVVIVVVRRRDDGVAAAGEVDQAVTDSPAARQA